MYLARHYNPNPLTLPIHQYYARHDEGTAYIPLGDRNRELTGLKGNEVEEREDNDRSINRVSRLEWALRTAKKELKKAQEQLQQMTENGAS